MEYEGKSASIDIEETDTVLNLKEKVGKEFHLEPEEILLLMGEQPISGDDKTLEQAGVQGGGLITVMKRTDKYAPAD